MPSARSDDLTVVKPGCDGKLSPLSCFLISLCPVVGSCCWVFFLICFTSVTVCARLCLFEHTGIRGWSCRVTVSVYSECTITWETWVHHTYDTFLFRRHRRRRRSRLLILIARRVGPTRIFSIYMVCIFSWWIIFCCRFRISLIIWSTDSFNLVISFWDLGETAVEVTRFLDTVTADVCSTYTHFCFAVTKWFCSGFTYLG